MKNIALFILLISIISCTSESSDTNNTESKSIIVSDFLDDISSIEEISDGNPIVLFQEKAENDADKVIQLSKDNIEDILTQAKKYKYCIITCEDHTIIKIVDLEDCTQSGSWGVCMPYTKGYIKKGELELQEDYLNNIIGQPDSQSRKVYFFN